MEHHDENARREHRRQWRREWRKERLASKPPPGQKWCRRCVMLHDLSAFTKPDVRALVICQRCRDAADRWKDEHRDIERGRMRKFRAENRSKVVLATKTLLNERPGLLRLFRVRCYVDDIWRYGPPQGRRYLTAHGYTYRDSCEECGATDPAPFASWETYAKPLHFTKLCPHHHKLRVHRVGKTAEQACAELKHVVPQAEKIYADFRAMGISMKKIAMLKAMAKS